MIFVALTRKLFLLCLIMELLREERIPPSEKTLVKGMISNDRTTYSSLLELGISPTNGIRRSNSATNKSLSCPTDVAPRKSTKGKKPKLKINGLELFMKGERDPTIYNRPSLYEICLLGYDDKDLTNKLK